MHLPRARGNSSWSPNTAGHRTENGSVLGMSGAGPKAALSLGWHLHLHTRWAQAPAHSKLPDNFGRPLPRHLSFGVLLWIAPPLNTRRTWSRGSKPIPCGKGSVVGAYIVLIERPSFITRNHQWFLTWKVIRKITAWANPGKLMPVCEDKTNLDGPKFWSFTIRQLPTCLWF